MNIEITKDPLQEAREALVEYRKQAPTQAHRLVAGLMRMGDAERTELMCWGLVVLLSCENARQAQWAQAQKFFAGAMAAAEVSGMTKQ